MGFSPSCCPAAIPQRAWGFALTFRRSGFGVQIIFVVALQVFPEGFQARTKFAGYFTNYSDAKEQDNDNQDNGQFEGAEVEHGMLTFLQSRG
jgi:hypothetical protein